MARKPRVWFPGAMYHITNRGNRRSSIFLDDEDRTKYLELLEKTRSAHPYILHAYCLMTNHTHLQIETIETQPKEIMNMLNFRYAIYFNKRHELEGHVFQGRYGSVMIDSREYFLEVSRYIHLNPVQAELVKHPADYPWSSYVVYESGPINSLVSTEKIFSCFDSPKLYRNYVLNQFPDVLVR
ncbi:REP-associated tyrosine transposase [Peribacillus glennii]|uniref:Transposase n=1 Tax=Peribacillus glennii TaxID=2303991 RepID=A0A372L8H2_9BACI|nr:transposase [Peribacillus glennii]RFU61155.1 transposase [Peribacillus glennii]